VITLVPTIMIAMGKRTQQCTDFQIDYFLRVMQNNTFWFVTETNPTVLFALNTGTC
jgi:hypothetical protein